MWVMLLCLGFQLQPEVQANISAGFAKLDAFRCQFQQDTYSAFFDDSRTGGTLAIQRPGKMRMQYREGERKLFIWDGETCYERDFLADTVSRTPQTDVRSEPLVRLLLYGSDLNKIFIMDRYQESGCDIYRLRPRDDDSYELLVTFDERWLPRTIEVIGEDGEGSLITLSDYELNPDFAPDTFQIPPATPGRNK